MLLLTVQTSDSVGDVTVKGTLNQMKKSRARERKFGGGKSREVVDETDCRPTQPAR